MSPSGFLVAASPTLPELFTIRQDSELTMIALGVGEHPALQPGNHLRWHIDPRLGFPQRGFELFRRPHVQPSVQVFNFAEEPRRALTSDERFGVFRWLSGQQPFFYSAAIERSINDPSRRNMLSPGANVNTCAFDTSLGALRRIVIEMVHDYQGPPETLTVWGTYQQHRVAGNSLVIGTANQGVPLTLVIDADALDGFQFTRGPWGILSIGYALVGWDAGHGWTPLWPDLIGLPVTAPGYRVPHKHGADLGTGERDWLEAADRMSPTGQAADLPVVLANRFGPPEFDNTRGLMRDALARRPIVVAEQNNRPAVEIDPIRLLLTAAIDPRVAAMLGLAWIDRTAQPRVAYDYRIAGYWHQPVKAPSPDRLLVPRQGLDLEIGVSYVTRAFPRGLGLTLESKSTAGQAAAWPTVTLSRDFVLDSRFPVEALIGLRIHERGGRTIQPRAYHDRADDVSVSRRLFQVRLGQPVTQLTVHAKGGKVPWAVLAVSKDEVVAAAAAEEGSASLELRAANIDALWIGGAALGVERIDLQPEEPPIRAREWICYNVVRGPVRTIQPPTIAAQTVPGLARASRPEHMVALSLEPEAAPPDGTFLPLARTRDQPVSFDVSRRSDGDSPRGRTDGNWIVLNVNQATDEVEPIVPDRQRLPLLREPDEWPPDSPHYLDTTLDPAVRWYAYRALGRDLFGRTSPWSDVVHVDAADRWGPPFPANVRARWIERGDPQATGDDVALLDVLGDPFAIRVQWDWPENLRAQAPDAARFRVYWCGGPFEEYLFAEIIEVLNARSPDSYRVRVTLPARIQNPPADAFAGDWLRQGHEQYLITASSPLNSTVLTVARGASPAPTEGDCSVSLRRPATAGIDQLGNPLRHDASSPLSWDERVAQGPLVSVRANVVGVSAGASVRVVAARPDWPRPNVASLELETTFRWDQPDLAGWTVTMATGDYPVLGGHLGAHSAALLVDIEGRQPPAPGLATLGNAAGTLGVIRTILREAQVPITVPLVLRGGSVAMDTLAPVGPIDRLDDVPPAPRSLVVGYRTNPRLELVVARISAGARVRWWPGFEAVIGDHPLAVSEDRTAAIGVVGVSAVDDRGYRRDVRVRTGEPTAPGNEGPIQSTRVRRAYFGSPAAQPEPDGVAGPNPLWAPEPEAFSAVSRFALRWPTAGATRFHVSHATLNAILDIDVAARRARRGLYVGAAELNDIGLSAHHVQQAALDPQGQRVLANQYPEAFSDLTREPIEAGDARWTRGQQPGWLRWFVPIDGHAPGRHFLRVTAVDAAGNRGDPGPVTLPIIVPDMRRPAAPNLRRAIPDERCVWIEWDHGGPDTSEFSIFRTDATSSTTPDIRQMQRIATVPADRTSRPLSVFAGVVSLGSPVDQVTAVYLARDYDVALLPLGQVAALIPGPYQIVRGQITGLDIPDGTLVHVVVARVPGGPSELIASGAAHAFCDKTAVADHEYVYRVVAIRQAQTGPGRWRAVNSLPSGVARAAAMDSRLPEPPAAQAVWDGAGRQVVITWNSAGRPPDEAVLLQRFEVDQNATPKRLSFWVPSTAGRLEDRTARSGQTYSYRLRTRRGTNRVSQNEPEIGPVVIP